MDTKVKGAGWWNTIIALLALVAGGVALWVSRTGTMPAPITCLVLAFLFIGFLVALVSSFHLQLLDREKQEKLEFEGATTGSADSSMFESDAFAARRSREHFDRWIIPIFTLFLLAVEIGVTFWVIWGNTRFYDFQQAQVLESSYVLVAVSSLFGMFLFLRGRYATLLSVKLNAVILQPGSDFLLLGAYLFFLQAAVSAAALLEYPLAHQYLAVCLCVFMGVLAVETLLRLILELYRPRMKGQEIRQLYHSRLVGLISKPEGFFTTAAHALDYQFGFKVSETWGYRFLRERLALIVLLQLFVLWLSSSIVIIPQGQVGYLERNGVAVETRAPGISFKWPWPIDSVQRHFQGAVRTLYIGPAMDPRRLGGRRFYWFEDGVKGGGKLHMPSVPQQFSQPDSLWSEPNVRDYDKSLERAKLYKTYFAARGADSVNTGDDKKALLFGGVFVQFRVSDVTKYANYSAEPIEVLEKLVTRQVTRHFGQSAVESILTTGRGKLASGILGAVQKQVDEIGLGLEVISVGLQGVQPPAEMAQLAATSEMDNDKTREAGAGSPVEKYEEYFASRIMNHGSHLLNSVGIKSVRSLALIEQTNKVALGQLEASDILRKALEQSDREDEFFKLYKKSPRVFPAFQLIDAQTNYLGSINSKVVLIGVDAEGFEVDLKQGEGGLLDAGGRVAVDPSQLFIGLNMKAKSTVVLVIGSLLLAVFLSLMFTYQVRSNEIVLVDSWSGGWKIKYGSATTVTDGNETSMEVKSDAGIQFRLPWPLEKVYKLDGRTHVLETGFDEELGAGGETLLVSVYAGWHVNNANLFRDNFGDQRTAGLMMRAADEKLRDYVESARDEVLGGTKLFMTPEQMEFRKENQANLTYMKAEKKIKEIVSTKAKGLGLGIKFLGIKRVGLPETQANGIIEGMVQLKKTKIEALNQETQQQSEAIQNTATTESRAIIEKAESNATRLRNEARSKVSEIYAQADSSPEKARLAITLKQIKALEVLRSEGKQIQLIISDNHPLFNVFDEAMQKQAPKK